MADLINSVGTAQTYTTWQAWEDACSADLVADGDNWIGEQINEELTVTSALTVSGITTNASNFLTMRTASGASFIDNATPGTDPLRYDTTKGAALRKTNAYDQLIDSSAVRLEIIGLQLKTDTGSKVIRGSGQTQPFLIKQCILDGDGERVVEGFRSSGDRSLLQNCVLIQSKSNGIGIYARDLDCEYTTIYGTGSTAEVVFGVYGLNNFDNCLFLNFGDWQQSTRVHTVDFCVTDLASWESSTANNSVLSATISNEIVNDSGVRTTCDLSAKAGGSADGGGTPLTVTVDIYGQTRDATTPTVGAFEIVAAGGDTNVSANVEALTITEQAASITLDVDVVASTEALTITEHSATIALGVNVSTATESLVITEQVATVALDVNVSASTEALTITSYQAVVEVGGNTNVIASTESLTITGQQASVGYDVDVAASTESLTLTTHAASVQLGANVVASVESLTITTNPASIGRDVGVEASTEALTITPHAATVESTGATTLTAQDITNIVDALFAKVVENGETFEQQLKLIRAEAAGKLSVTGNTVSFRDAADSKDRIVATVDDEGQRTAITTDVS